MSHNRDRLWRQKGRFLDKKLTALIIIAYLLLQSCSYCRDLQIASESLSKCQNGEEPNSIEVNKFSYAIKGFSEPNIVFCTQGEVSGAFYSVVWDDIAGADSVIVKLTTDPEIKFALRDKDTNWESIGVQHSEQSFFVSHHDNNSGINLNITEVNADTGAVIRILALNDGELGDVVQLSLSADDQYLFYCGRSDTIPTYCSKVLLSDGSSEKLLLTPEALLRNFAFDSEVQDMYLITSGYWSDLYTVAKINFVTNETKWVRSTSCDPNDCERQVYFKIAFDKTDKKVCSINAIMYNAVSYFYFHCFNSESGELVGTQYRIPFPGSFYAGVFIHKSIVVMRFIENSNTVLVFYDSGLEQIVTAYSINQDLPVVMSHLSNPAILQIFGKNDEKLGMYSLSFNESDIDGSFSGLKEWSKYSINGLEVLEEGSMVALPSDPLLTDTDSLTTYTYHDFFNVTVELDTEESYVLDDHQYTQPQTATVESGLNFMTKVELTCSASGAQPIEHHIDVSKEGCDDLAATVVSQEDGQYISGQAPNGILLKEYTLCTYSTSTSYTAGTRIEKNVTIKAGYESTDAVETQTVTQKTVAGVTFGFSVIGAIFGSGGFTGILLLINLQQIYVLLLALDVYIHNDIRFIIASQSYSLLGFQFSGLADIISDSFLGEYDQNQEWLLEAEFGSKSLIVNISFTLFAIFMTFTAHRVVHCVFRCLEICRSKNQVQGNNAETGQDNPSNDSRHPLTDRNNGDNSDEEDEGGSPEDEKDPESQESSKSGKKRSNPSSSFRDQHADTAQNCIEENKQSPEKKPCCKRLITWCWMQIKERGEKLLTKEKILRAFRFIEIQQFINTYLVVIILGVTEIKHSNPKNFAQFMSYFMSIILLILCFCFLVLSCVYWIRETKGRKEIQYEKAHWHGLFDELKNTRWAGLYTPLKLCRNLMIALLCILLGPSLPESTYLLCLVLQAGYICLVSLLVGFKEWWVRLMVIVNEVVLFFFLLVLYGNRKKDDWSSSTIYLTQYIILANSILFGFFSALPYILKIIGKCKRSKNQVHTKTNTEEPPQPVQSEQEVEVELVEQRQNPSISNQSTSQEESSIKSNHDEAQNVEISSQNENISNKNEETEHLSSHGEEEKVTPREKEGQMDKFCSVIAQCSECKRNLKNNTLSIPFCHMHKQEGNSSLKIFKQDKQTELFKTIMDKKHKIQVKYKVPGSRPISHGKNHSGRLTPSNSGRSKIGKIAKDMVSSMVDYSKLGPALDRRRKIKPGTTTQTPSNHQGKGIPTTPNITTGTLENSSVKKTSNLFKRVSNQILRSKTGNIYPSNLTTGRRHKLNVNRRRHEELNSNEESKGGESSGMHIPSDTSQNFKEQTSIRNSGKEVVSGSSERTDLGTKKKYGRRRKRM